MDIRSKEFYVVAAVLALTSLVSTGTSGQQNAEHVIGQEPAAAQQTAATKSPADVETRTQDLSYVMPSKEDIRNFIDGRHFKIDKDSSCTLGTGCSETLDDLVQGKFVIISPVFVTNDVHDLRVQQVGSACPHAGMLRFEDQLTGFSSPEPVGAHDLFSLTYVPAADHGQIALFTAGDYVPSDRDTNGRDPSQFYLLDQKSCIVIDSGQFFTTDLNHSDLRLPKPFFAMIRIHGRLVITNGEIVAGKHSPPIPTISFRRVKTNRDEKNSTTFFRAL